LPISPFSHLAQSLPDEDFSPSEAGDDPLPVAPHPLAPLASHSYTQGWSPTFPRYGPAILPSPSTSTAAPRAIAASGLLPLGLASPAVPTSHYQPSPTHTTGPATLATSPSTMLPHIPRLSGLDFEPDLPLLPPAADYVARRTDSPDAAPQPIFAMSAAKGKAPASAKRARGHPPKPKASDADTYNARPRRSTRATVSHMLPLPLATTSAPPVTPILAEAISGQGDSDAPSPRTFTGPSAALTELATLTGSTVDADDSSITS